ncbi:MAG TPA: DUF222 domain-containing protein [Streptosporangiaceae bacterium]|nr:DUF222 domain-containing protein [Streptosporangiaceae bacterium]
MADPAGGPIGGPTSAPVLVRDDGVLLSGVDEEAAWGGAGQDELRWSFGVGLAEAELPLADLGSVGLVADALPAGPGLAAWADQCPPERLPDADLPAVAAALRRVTSWAQATELAVVAQIAARSAARDPETGLAEDGRPDAVTRDAAAQIGLALTLSPGAASWWAELAVTLGWRLRATGAALAAGQIDLTRARIIAELTAVLDDEAARAVEDQILSGAGGQTYGQLRAAVNRAVILADPAGAEERRRAAERRARVGLYPGDHHTATLTGMNLPAVHAAAAMARLTAMARAMQAAGAGGGLDLLRAHAYLGLLLNTLPPIPPRPDAPPDSPPDGPDDPGPGGDGGPGGDQPRSGGSPGGPARGQSGRSGSRGAGGPGSPPRSGGSRPGGGRGSRGDSGGPPCRDRAPSGGPGPADSEPGEAGTAGHASDSGHDPPADQCGHPPGVGRSGRHPGGPSPGPPGPPPPERAPPGPHPSEHAPPGPDARSDPLPPEGWPADSDAPPDDGIRPPSIDVPDGYVDEGGYPDYDLYDEPADPNPIPVWPGVPATITAAFGWPGQPNGLAPEPASGAAGSVRGRLELTLGWSALALGSASPGTLTRIGPVTAEQARLLAAVAATSPATRWRVILTDSHGHALAVTAIPRHATRPRQDRGRGLVGRVTVTMPITALDGPLPADGHPLLAAIADTAARLLLRLRQEAEASQEAGPDDCTHQGATSGYRPTTAIREYVRARDQTCRYPCCRQPAWHGDLDHTRPWHQGGRTCPCNLGALCRAHHILKQLQGWTLTQPRPGVFQWTTPAGRSYTTEPDVHPA